MQLDSGKIERMLEEELSEEISHFIDCEKALWYHEDGDEVLSKKELRETKVEKKRLSEKIMRRMKEEGVKKLYRGSWKMTIVKGTSGEFLELD